MRSDRELKMGSRQIWAAVIALALLSSVSACSKKEAAAAASPQEQVATAPDAGVQAQPKAPPAAAVERPAPAQPSPDEALADRVKTTLVGAGLGVLAVDVAATNGAITLYGTVDSSAVRDQAARVAGSVAGVKSVANELVVVRGS